MDQVNLNLLKDAKNSLQKTTSQLEIYHLKNKGSISFLDRADTEFWKWYKESGCEKDYNSLETYFNNLLDNYNQYYETEKSPLQKGFFSDGKSKRKSELDNLFLKTIKSKNKLFSAINLIVSEIKHSEIILNETDNKKIANNEDKEISILPKPVMDEEISKLENEEVEDVDTAIIEEVIKPVEIVQETQIINEEPIEEDKKDNQELNVSGKIDTDTNKYVESDEAIKLRKMIDDVFKG